MGSICSLSHEQLLDVVMFSMNECSTLNEIIGKLCGDSLKLWVGSSIFVVQMRALRTRSFSYQLLVMTSSVAFLLYANLVSSNTSTAHS